jgi:hypothetical protein
MAFLASPASGVSDILNFDSMQNEQGSDKANTQHAPTPPQVHSADLDTVSCYLLHLTV